MKKNNFIQKHQKGFTIIELLIATTVFSVILLVATTGVIRIGQTYYKGIIQARTQETTRAVSEELTRSLQFNGSGVVRFPPPDDNKICLGNVRYTHHVGVKVTGNSGGLIAHDIPQGENCIASAGTNQRQLLGENMRLLKFKVDEADSSGLIKVQVRIAYGDADLLTAYPPNASEGSPPLASPGLENAACQLGTSASSFCATARLDTLVKKRL